MNLPDIQQTIPKVQIALKKAANNDEAEGVKTMINKYYGNEGIPIRKK